MRPGNLHPVAILHWMSPRRESAHVWQEVIRVKREKESGPGALVAQLLVIQQMKTGALRAELERLTGVPSRSWNRGYLVRKVSWLVQRAWPEARQGAAGEAPGVEEVRSHRHCGPIKAPIQPAPVRDLRLPKPGTVLIRPYKGLRLTVQVLEDGFEWNGQAFKSLSAVATAITGDHVSGPFFFGFRKRKRASP